MPVATLAGALALAGCGGSDNKPAVVNNKGEPQGCPSGQIMHKGSCMTPEQIEAAAAAAAAAAAKPGGMLVDTEGLTTANVQSILKGSGSFASGMTRNADKAVVDEITLDGVMTWIEALNAVEVGDGKIKDYAVPVSGDLTSAETNTPADTFVAEDTMVSDVTYKGIPGVATCKAKDSCRIGDGDKTGTKKFTGIWHFVPRTANSIDWRTADIIVNDKGDYVLASTKAHARYGYWLAADDAGGAWRMHRFSNGSGGTPVLTASGTNPVNTAKYEGDAYGVSVLSGTNPRSGSFNAKVELTAKFDGPDDSTLEGKVHGFKGTAVKDNWELTLKKMTAASSAFTGGVASGGDTLADGTWTATAYGANGEHPTGFTGGFHGHLPGGSAAGVYAAE